MRLRSVFLLTRAQLRRPRKRNKRAQQDPASASPRDKRLHPSQMSRAVSGLRLLSFGRQEPGSSVQTSSEGGDDSWESPKTGRSGYFRDHRSREKARRLRNLRETGNRCPAPPSEGRL